MLCTCSIIFTVSSVSYLLLMMQSWASLSRSWACEACSDNSSWDRHPDVPNVLSSWDPDSHKVCQKPHSTHSHVQRQQDCDKSEKDREGGREGGRVWEERWPISATTPTDSNALTRKWDVWKQNQQILEPAALTIQRQFQENAWLPMKIWSVSEIQLNKEQFLSHCLSSSCCSELAWLTFFNWTQKETFWKMYWPFFDYQNSLKL